MELSIIIPTRNRSDSLSQTLDSIKNQSKYPRDVIIIDSSDNTKTKEMVLKKKKQMPFVTVYRHSVPGIPIQRNRGIDIVDADLVCFFDDDVVLEPQCLKILFETYKKTNHQGVEGIMGKIVNMNTEYSFVDWLFKKFFFLNDCGNGAVKLSGLPSLSTGNRPKYVQSLSGCFMAYGKIVFDHFRFDENLKNYAYMEDVDFSYRVAKKYKLFYQPEAKLAHYPTTYKTVDTYILRKMFIRNHRYLFKKNFSQNYIHRITHWLSIIGLILYNFTVARDLHACKGIIDGIKEPLRPVPSHRST